MAGEARSPRNFLHCWTEGIMVVAHTAINPSRAEWDEMIADVARRRPRMIGTLVYTEGGSPSAFQRKQLREVFLYRGVSPPSAVLTTSALARAAISAMNLFMGGSVKAFTPEDIEEGLCFLEAPQDKWPLLKKTLEELKRELGIRAQ